MSNTLTELANKPVDNSLKNNVLLMSAQMCTLVSEEPEMFLTPEKARNILADADADADADKSVPTIASKYKKHG